MSQDLHAHAGQDAASPPPRVNRPLVFVTISGALMMMTIDSTIVATALDTLQHALNTTINWAAWTMTAYMFGFVLMLPVSGKLSERYGRKRVFLASTAVFTVTSLLCGLASNIYLLIVLRALQAAGGAGFTPSATGIVVDYFGGARDRAVSLFGSIIPVGAMLGPIFGGYIVKFASWPWIFLINVPVGVLVFLLTLYSVPHDPVRPRHEHTSPDLLGMLLLSIGLLGSMFAINGLADTHMQLWSAAFAVPAVLACAALVWFFFHIQHHPNPFIAPRFLMGEHFGAVNVFNAIYGGTTLGIVSLVPHYATARYGLDPLDAGILLTAEGVAVVTTTTIAAFALRKTGHRPPLYIGVTLIAAGLMLLHYAHLMDVWTPIARLMLSTFIIGVGFGCTNPASRNAGLQLAPDHSSTLAALRTMALNMGMIVAVSITTALVAMSNTPADMYGHVYIAIVVMFVVFLPVVHKIPEHRGAW